VQRYVASDAGPVTAPVAPAISVPGPAGTTLTATPVVQRAEDPAAPTPQASGGPATTARAPHTDRELDELARALFGRLRTQLRHEVIHEREAKGLSFDAF
jgi:hypothetical protein